MATFIICSVLKPYASDIYFEDKSVFTTETENLPEL